jgi:PPK2 family polyphosphate:nucleotide phosphotransferase
MNDLTELYRVLPGKALDLSKIDPAGKTGFKFSDEAEEETQHLLERMFELQELLYAVKKQNMLIVLQGLDTAGKDGVVRHVFRGLNPEGLKVACFKGPSGEELSHDFLWRIHKNAPAKGEIVIFNRSHYEDVLVVRVRKLVPKDVWKERYAQINAFEKLLRDGNVTFVKCFLHISSKEQRQRLEDRLRDPKKQWKLGPSDIEDRRLWNDFQKAYDDALTQCNTEHAPWHIVPSDKKWYRNLVVARLLRATLERLDPQFPPFDSSLLAKLD